MVDQNSLLGCCLMINGYLNELLIIMESNRVNILGGVRMTLVECGLNAIV